jgi:glycosyltransferase involved in cell wall biosynthesis
MRFNPKVSIVIPVYNGSNYLQEAIDSALSQTYRDIEVIVVNDGSTDQGQTEEIVKTYGSKIRYFCKENGGVASALNLGIRNMTGEYFSWLSHDDVYYPIKIERQIKHLEKKANKQTITYCDCEIIDKASNLISRPRMNQDYLKNIYLTILSTSIGGCSLLIPKQCFEQVGVFNESLTTTQDNEMWLRIAKQGFAFEYLPEFLVKSRHHPEQGSNIIKGYHQKERREFYQWSINYISNETASISKELKRILLLKKSYKAYNQILKLEHSSKIMRQIILIFDFIFIWPFIKSKLVIRDAKEKSFQG